MMANRFLRLYVLQVLFGFMLTFGWNFAVLHYLNLGFSYEELLIFNVVSYASAVAVMLGLREVHAYRSIKAAVFLFILIFLLLIELDSGAQLLVISIFAGATIPLFWIPVNVIFFRLRGKDNVAFFSSVGFFMIPALSTIVPYLSGVVIKAYGYPAVFGLSVVILCVILAYLKKIEEPLLIDLRVSHAYAATRKISSLIFVEGFWQGVNWIVFPLYTYYFIKESVSYGAFLSYIGFAGACASLVLARTSDRLKKRSLFVCSTVFLTALLTIISGAASSEGAWVLSRTLVGFAGSLYAPFTLTVILDGVSSTRLAMVGRELFLNAGRTLGGVFVLAAYAILGELQSTLVVSGVVFLLYPLLLSRSRFCA